MIVSKKALLAVAAIPIIVALAIAISKISSGDQASSTASTSARISIQFVKQDMKRVSFGVTETVAAQKSETLIISNDGTTLYDIEAEGEKGSQTKFQVDTQELKEIKALVSETGFMQIPKEEFNARDNVTEFTRYTLTVNLDSSTKTVRWVDESSSKDFVPALLVNLGDTLLKIINEHKI